METLLDKLKLSMASDVSFSTVILALIISFIMGLIISFVYKKTHSGFSYAGSFNFTLILVTVIVSVIMMIIGSNIALSLGLIGSLSIIRFRTVVKDTKDMAYLFWAIAEGLAVGAGNYLTALICVFFVGALVFLMDKMNISQAIKNSYIMIVHLDLASSDAGQKAIGEHLKKNAISGQVRSSLVDKDSKIREITYSLKAATRKADFESLMNELNGSKNVKKVSLLTPETNLFI